MPKSSKSTPKSKSVPKPVAEPAMEDAAAASDAASSTASPAPATTTSKTASATPEVAPGAGKKRHRTRNDDRENITAVMKGQSRRYIVFVGNMPFTAKPSDVREHFASIPGLQSLRMLTKKSGESKGCAFLEFDTSDAVRKILKLHHSKMEGRRINVELTVGGGGNNDDRKQRIQDKNSRVHEQRRKAHAGAHGKPAPGAGAHAARGAKGGDARGRRQPRDFSRGPPRARAAAAPAAGHMTFE